MKILSVIIIICNFIAISSSYAWDEVLIMLDEAEKITACDLKKLRPIYKTKEEITLALSQINPSPTHSQFYEKYKDDALRLISYHTEFNGYGIPSIPPWVQIAGITLGTSNLEEALVGLVALGDIRGIPSFQRALLHLTSSIDKGENSVESLIKEFEEMRAG
jgi:hypothetical protein